MKMRNGLRQATNRRTLTFTTLGVLLVGLSVFGVAAPASAAAAPCSGNPPSCGYIRNGGSYSFTASTDYVNTTTVAAGAKKATVSAGSRTPVGWDWDAVWVPAGRCVVSYGGTFWNIQTKTDRVGQTTGRWHKIDNWGARALMYTGHC